MNYLVLLRHGESEWNVKKLIQGQKDIFLTEKGVEQAKQAGQLLQNFSFDKVFASPLKRALNTAEIVLECLAADIEILQQPSLKEQDFGELVGMNHEEGNLLHYRTNLDAKPPGGESYQEVTDRIQSCYAGDIAPHVEVGENVLVVFHGGSMPPMLRALGLDFVETTHKSRIPNALPLVFEFEDGKFVKHYVLDENGEREFA